MTRTLLASMIAFTACTASQPDDTSDQQDAPVGKADAASYPSGTYTDATPHIGELSMVTLNDDFTYSRYQLGACPGGGTCTPALQTGTYLFTHGSKYHYIRFYDSDGNFVDRFAWKLETGGKLELNQDAKDHWFTLAPDTSSGNDPQECTEATDCSGILPDFCRLCSDGTSACAHWSCLSNQCEIVTCS